MADVSLVLVAVLSCMVVSVQGLNITEILEPFPDYSLFSQWLTTTGVADQINPRATITVLATSNTAWQSYLSSVEGAIARPELVADTLRYQVLLTYFSWSELQEIAVNNYTTATTLLQTTGRTNDTGFINIYNKGNSTILVGHRVADSYGNQTVIANVTSSPYDYSVLEISGVLIPLPTFLPAPLPAPTYAPVPSVEAPAIRSPPGTTVPRAASTSYASMTRVTLPLTLTALFVASVTVLV